MRIARQSRSAADEERILPLINIVFLLLIFFMVVGKLSSADPFEVAPPESASETVPEPPGATVLVAADGRLALDGMPIEDAALGPALAELAGDEPLERVWLRADARSEALRVIAVMELLRDAGVERLRLLTLENEP